MSRPIFVVISDVHYTLATLELADTAVRSAIKEAHTLNVPLVIAGDLHDTKDIIRGVCANAMIETFKLARKLAVDVYVMIGNHDKTNEKSEAHSLNFLQPYVTIVDKPEELPVHKSRVLMVPYQNDSARLIEILADHPRDGKVIMHQGVRGAYMGEYTVDKTSIDPGALAKWKVISGHYHKHQTIGTVTYIGSPYTITFAEANDGPKGFQVVMDDFSMRQVVLNLRKHIIVEREVADVMKPIEGLRKDDILWLKLSGPAVELDQLSKSAIGKQHLGHANFKLDKIPTDVQGKVRNLEKMSTEQILDSVIDESDEKAGQKKYLRKLWREVMQ